jgi:hypothetical protein
MCKNALAEASTARNFGKVACLVMLLSSRSGGGSRRNPQVGSQSGCEQASHPKQLFPRGNAPGDGGGLDTSRIARAFGL